MNKIYSGFHQLPHGNASTMVQAGCIVLAGGAFRGLYGCLLSTSLQCLTILLCGDVCLFHCLVLVQELRHIITSSILFYNLAKIVPTFVHFHKFPH